MSRSQSNVNSLTTADTSVEKLFISRVGLNTCESEIKWAFEQDLDAGKVTKVSLVRRLDKKGAGYFRVYLELQWHPGNDSTFRCVLKTKEYIYKHYVSTDDGSYEKWSIMKQIEYEPKKPKRATHVPIQRDMTELDVDPTKKLDLFIMRVSPHISTDEVRCWFSRYGAVTGVNSNTKLDRHGKPYNQMFVNFGGWNNSRESCDIWNGILSNGQYDMANCVYEGERWSLRALNKRVERVEIEPQMVVQQPESALPEAEERELVHMMRADGIMFDDVAEHPGYAECELKCMAVDRMSPSKWDAYIDIEMVKTKVATNEILAWINNCDGNDEPDRPFDGAVDSPFGAKFMESEMEALYDEAAGVWDRV